MNTSPKPLTEAEKTEKSNSATFRAKLAKILALTKSPVEGEAHAATVRLQEICAEYNIEVASIEEKGATAPGIERKSHDLGKAAFKWKLNLAEKIAEHFFCYAMVDHRQKTVNFVGRPDNVEAMQMLYGWLIEQIKQISATERKAHQTKTGEHVDPLRWQVNFGLGVVDRLGDRLGELKKQQQDEAGTALVLHHGAEISDYLEAQFGYRTDGRETKYQRERREQREREAQEEAKRDADWQTLFTADPESAYAERPWERPETPEEAAAREVRWEKERKEDEKRERRNQARRSSRGLTLGGGYRAASPEQERKDDQAYRARETGRGAAAKLNLEPFLTDKAQKDLGT